jgi:hypothetical protein
MRLAAGGGLTISMALVAGLLWGARGAMAAAGFGLLATAIQVAASRFMRGAARSTTSVFFKRWAAGMGLRLGGVVALAILASAHPDLFPPLAAAVGYLGVLIPLLFLELRSDTRHAG